MLSKAEKDYLIDLLENGENIPEDFKHKLFPIEHKEYELAYAGKMRKEDLLANDDGSFPVPLQIEKVFNGDKHPSFDDGWKNLIVFGDNLQFLKTIYKNEDPVIKDKVKGKVKLIYIDPPFATSDEFKNKDGAKAYNDKKLGAEFVEFIRRRLILAKEILADDGSIFVHLDQKMGHYIKIVMDEVFGKNSLKNEIIWFYPSGGDKTKYFQRKHDVILYYSKSNNYYFDENAAMVPYTEKQRKRFKEYDEDTQRWFYWNVNPRGERVKTYLKDGIIDYDVWNIGIDASKNKYPTQKPEQLLKKIIETTTKKGDIVMDFFCGSGRTAEVAEKLGRKWITCDIGKLSFYTVQRRILKISESKSLTKKTAKYKKNPRAFITCSLGNYDLKEALDLEYSKYKEFVSGLFDIDLKEHQIGGYSFDGKKDDYPVVIYNYNLHKESNVDEAFISDINNHIGKRMGGGRVYIVSPTTRVDYITDYEELDGIRYYFLKIPYQIIKELHQKDYKKFRQPRSKENVNALDDSIGFSFNRTPIVDSSIKCTKDKIAIIISKFSSVEPRTSKTAEEKQLNGYDLLSAVFIDKNYNGSEFIMTDAMFADEILCQNNKFIIELNKTEVGEKIMIVYTDIFGNDLTECFSIKEG